MILTRPLRPARLAARSLVFALPPPLGDRGEDAAPLLGREVEPAGDLSDGAGAAAAMAGRRVDDADADAGREQALGQSHAPNWHARAATKPRSRPIIAARQARRA